MAMTDEDLKEFLEKVMDVERGYANEERNATSKRKAEVRKLVDLYASRFAIEDSNLENEGAA